MNIFKRIFKKPIYEIYMFEGNQTMVSRDVKKMQEEGWELAGQITCSFSQSGSDRMLVPLKKRIK